LRPRMGVTQSGARVVRKYEELGLPGCGPVHQPF